MVNSMKQIYNKSNPLSVKPIVRFQCVRFFFPFREKLSSQKSPPLPRAKNFATAQYANQTHGAIADGGLFVVTYWQFLHQSRLSDSIKHHSEPTRYILHRNLVISIFVAQNGCVLQGTTRFWSCKRSGMPLKK